MKFRGRTVILLVLLTAMFTSVTVLAVPRMFSSGSALLAGAGFSTPHDFNSNFEKLRQTYDVICKAYIRPIDEQALMDGAIQGMLSALGDPHTTYMPPKIAQQFKERLQSSFTGIGAETTIKDGKITIVSPIKGSPAEKAGLRPEDQISKVNGVTLVGMDLNEAVSRIKGPKGTKVELEILRPGLSEPLKMVVVRDQIPLETVYSRFDEQEKIGVLKVTQFSEDTSKDFARELAKLEEKRIKGLVIDVRNNPGGLLPAVQGMLDQLVPNNRPIFMMENKSGKREVTRSSAKSDSPKPYSIVVLIDRGSASASEVLAAALSESAGAKLIGETSYGKGTVQSTAEFTDGSNIKLTIAKWLTPKGGWIDQHGGSKGVKPDTPVEQPAFFMLLPPHVTNTLRLDDNTDVVKATQNLLDALGYNPGRRDGYFDSKTEQAVRSFQKSCGIRVSGEINAETADKLQAALVKLRNDPKNDLQMQVAFRTLSKGSR